MTSQRAEVCREENNKAALDYARPTQSILLATIDPVPQHDPLNFISLKTNPPAVIGSPIEQTSIRPRSRILRVPYRFNKPDARKIMLKGIFPVLPTLFGTENTLDLQGQQRVIRFALSAQVNGLVFPGVASEFQFLSTTERDTLIRQLVTAVDSQVPIIGGASAGTADEAIELGSAMAKHGIRTLMIMAPNNLGPQVESQLRFFQCIASALPDCEIMLQNAPSPIGAGLSAETLLQIIQDVPTLRYVKEESLPSGPTISKLRAQAPSHLNGIFGGGGARFIIDELNRGSLGAMPAVEVADLHVALYQAATNQDAAHARTLYRLSLPLLVAQSIYRMRLTKHVLHRRGIPNSGIVRADLPALDADSRSDIDSMVEDLKTAAMRDQAFDWIDAPQ